MTITEFKKISLNILKEYSENKDSVFNSFSGKNKTKGTGKKADNIATGKAKQYKDDTYLTKYEKEYPNLAKITQRLKERNDGVGLIVVEPALTDLLNLIQSVDFLKNDEKDRKILPMGDNIRLLSNGQGYILKYVGNEQLEPEQIDIENSNEILVSDNK